LIELPALRDDGAVNVVVESPRGSSAKFKYDPPAGVFMLSRPLPYGLVYPHDWGFIPSTHMPDGDPLDAMVLWEGVSYPGVVIPCRLIGVLQVEQNRKSSPGRERNDRVLALPVRASHLEWTRASAILIRRCAPSSNASSSTRWHSNGKTFAFWDGETQSRRTPSSKRP